MKLLVYILPVLWFLYQSKTPGNIRPLQTYADTIPIAAMVLDLREEDTTTVPTDTTTHSSGPRNNLRLEELYNNFPFDPNVKGYKTSDGSCCAWSQNLSDSVFNSPDSSLRLEVRRTDPYIAGSPRSEDNVPSTFEPVTDFEAWYGLAVFFPSDYLFDQSPEMFTQWHHKSNTGSPPVGMWTQSDHIFLALNGTRNQDFGLIPKGVWTYFVYHIIWDTDPADNGATEGLIEIWINDVKVYTKAGVNSPAGLPNGPYMKWGLYCWKWSHGYPSTIDKRIIFIDDVRIGNANATYADVRP